MKTKTLCAALAVSLWTALSGLSIASATSLEFVATSQSPVFTGFDVIFDDVVGDGLLRLGEVTSFSGTTARCTPNCDIFESKLLLVPDLAGVSSGAGTSWGFGNDLSGSSIQAVGAASLWTYETVQLPIPEPVTLALLGPGLAGLILFTSRERRGRGKRPIRGAPAPAGGASAGKRALMAPLRSWVLARSCSPGSTLLGGIALTRRPFETPW
jgi:hypothetical protein